jgi:hypothetical protein
VEAIVDVAINTPYQRVLSWSLDVLQVLAKSTATCHSQLHPGKSTDEIGIHYTKLFVLYLISGFHSNVYFIIAVCFPSSCLFILDKIKLCFTLTLSGPLSDFVYSSYREGGVKLALLFFSG